MVYIQTTDLITAVLECFCCRTPCKAIPHVKANLGISNLNILENLSLKYLYLTCSRTDQTEDLRLKDHRDLLIGRV